MSWGDDDVSRIVKESKSKTDTYYNGERYYDATIDSK